MHSKHRLRKRYLSIRKKRYFEISTSFFDPLIQLIKKKFPKQNINLSCYYPASHEVNVLKLFETSKAKNFNILLPILRSEKTMYFGKWEKNDVMKINKFGMIEPLKQIKKIDPNIMIIPLLAFDLNNNRLGYGGGFYDRFLNKFLKKNKKILTIGIAFSFQRHHKLPISVNDVKLDHILTEKGIN